MPKGSRLSSWSLTEQGETREEWGLFVLLFSDTVTMGQTFLGTKERKAMLDILA